MRGNPPDRAAGLGRSGSIPASAGEPLLCRGSTGGGGVYPRKCGGTRRLLPVAKRVEGLSPQVRGNRARTHRAAQHHGSIPASAGEPQGPSIQTARSRVYPRKCGGTRAGASPEWSGRGLSPQVRGNHPTLEDIGAALGSIPASAGEPGEGKTTQRFSGVYPRKCGGTGISRLA